MFGMKSSPGKGSLKLSTVHRDSGKTRCSRVGTQKKRPQLGADQLGSRRRLCPHGGVRRHRHSTSPGGNCSGSGRPNLWSRVIPHHAGRHLVPVEVGPHVCTALAAAGADEARLRGRTSPFSPLSARQKSPTLPSGRRAGEVPYVGTRRRDVHHDQWACGLWRCLRCGAALVGVIYISVRSPAAHAAYLRSVQSR